MSGPGAEGGLAGSCRKQPARKDSVVMHNSVKFAEFDLHEPLASGLGSIERQLVFVVGTEKHDVIVGEDFELLLQIANAHGRFHGSHFEIPAVGRNADGTPSLFRDNLEQTRRAVEGRHLQEQERKG